MPSEIAARSGEASSSSLRGESPGTSAADLRRRSAPGSPWCAATLVGLAALVVYVRTLAASIVWGDSPELTAAAYNAGVPHPTGYPLYMMLAHGFIRLFPLGSVAHRMNLLTAISASLAVALTYPLMLRISRSRIASLAATLMFAYGLTFWSQAVIAEVYAFHMLCITAVLGCVLAWDAKGERRWLFASMAGYGLCFTHHMMSVLMAPGLLFFALTSRHRGQFVRELPRTLLLFLLPICLYAYLPLAAQRNPPLNWNDPSNWENFLRHVTGRQYRPAMFHMSSAQFWGRVRDYTGLGLKGSMGLLPAQFPVSFLWLAPVGAWSLARRRRRLLGLTFLVYLVDVIYALNYLVPDVDVYYLPSHLIVAIWIACGLRQLGVWLHLLGRRLALPAAGRRLLNPLGGLLLLAMPVLLLTENWSVNDHHDDWNALNYAHASLATLKPHAVLFGEGDAYYFPLLYARHVEQYRPDVTMLEEYNVLCPARLRLTTRLVTEGLTVRVPPCFQHGHRGGVRDHNCLLKQLIRDNIDARPIYVTGPADLLQKPWLAEAIAPYCQVVDVDPSRIELTRRPPVLAVAHPRPQREERVAFGVRCPDGSVRDDLELLGYDVQPIRRGTSRLLQIAYYWRIHQQAAARSATVWVLFTDRAGNYRRKDDGSPEFHNIHPLAYGLGGALPHLPQTLRETFTIYVPPSEWDQRRTVRIAVAQAGQFLATRPPGAPWVQLGDLSLTPVRTARQAPGAVTVAHR